MKVGVVEDTKPQRGKENFKFKFPSCPPSTSKVMKYRLNYFCSVLLFICLEVCLLVCNGVSVFIRSDVFALLFLKNYRDM